MNFYLDQFYMIKNKRRIFRSSLYDLIFLDMKLRFYSSFLICVLILSTGYKLLAQPGTIDSTFAINGMFLFNSGKWVGDLMVLPDNKIIGAIQKQFQLFRLTEDGMLDSTFGQNGFTEIILHQYTNWIYQIDIQQDQKIVMVGYSGNILVQTYRSTIARFNQDGSLDTNFGNKGLIIQDISPEDYDIFSSVAIQSDGKIIVGANFSLPDNGHKRASLYRYNQNGTLDNLFGINGEVEIFAQIVIAYRYVSVILQPDGKIIGSTLGRNNSQHHAVILRLNIDGTRDSTFGENGMVLTELGDDTGDLQRHFLSLLPDGKILLAGACSPGAGTQGFIIRYNIDGSIDPSFAQDGRLFFEQSSQIASLTVQPDGKILGTADAQQFCFFRLNPEGSFDLDFGDEGWVYPDIIGENFGCDIESIALQHGGRILIGGQAFFDYYTYIFMARYYSGLDCPIPIASFSYINNDTAISFYDESSSATRWLWDFGDGSQSSEQNPIYQFQRPGKYIVCLTVYDTCGTSSYCDTIFNCEFVETKFSFVKNGLTVYFSDSSIMASQWLWDFGDGSFSDVQNPIYTFPEKNLYSVCLWSANDCNSELFCDSIDLRSYEINEIANRDIEIYPIPVSEFLNIILMNNQLNNCIIEINNIYGETVFLDLMKNEREQINTTYLLPGFYIMTVHLNDKIIRKNFIKI